MNRFFVLVALLLAGCDAIAVPTVPPTRALSGPTMAPTDAVIPAPPSEVPSSFYDTFGSSDPTVAALPNDLELPPLALGGESGAQSVEITLPDRQVSGTLYMDVPVRAPGVMLISENSSRWGAFPEFLESSGYVVLSVELQATDSTIITELIASFSELAQGDASRLDPGRIAVIGELAGADLALRGCAVDPRCDVLGLLSPQDQTGSALAVEQFSPRPLLLSASQDDPLSYALTESLATGARGEVLLQPFISEGRGAEIVTNRPDFADLIVTWLNRNLRA